MNSAHNVYKLKDDGYEADNENKDYKTIKKIDVLLKFMKHIKF